jgi:hypothetical protein
LKGTRWPGALALLAGLAFAFSVLVADEARDAVELDARLRDAKATLLSTEIAEWRRGTGRWNAFGTFDVAAGDHRGTARASLEPEARRHLSRTNRIASREVAASFLASWAVGRTYDAYWDPEHPDHVFFVKADVSRYNRAVVGLRALAAGLLVASFLVFWRGRR